MFFSINEGVFVAGRFGTASRLVLVGSGLYYLPEARFQRSQRPSIISFCATRAS